MDKYFRVNENVNGYAIQKLLGEGRYGIAYLAVNDRYEKCVVKQLKREMLEQGRGKLFYEEQILRRLNDPRFPKFISKFRDDYREGYLLEYIEGTAFHDLIARKRYQFNRRSIYAIAGQLLAMIDFLQKNNIVHRDIRPPNIIVRDSKELVLIDFGLARYIDNERYTKQNDYWYLGDFLIYLYYTSYRGISTSDRPWYNELELKFEEKKLLLKLMGLESQYHNVDEIKAQIDKIKRTY